MKKVLQGTAHLISRNILSTAAVIALFGTSAFAAAPTGGYLPGATLNPDCAPSDTDCIVQNVGTETDPLRKFVEGSGSVNAVYTGGMVGIGTDNPEVELNVVGGALASIQVGESTDDYYTNVGTNAVWFTRDGAPSYIRQNGLDGEIRFRMNSGGSNLDAITIQGSTGYVGIGTNTPSRKLDVAGDIDVNGLTLGRGPMNNVYSTTFGHGANPLGTANYNLAIGMDALKSTTTGGGNTAVGGLRALEDNVTGIRHTAVGMYALRNNIDGSSNTALGYDAMQGTTGGNYNVGVGYRSLGTIGTGSDNNIGLGTQAGRSFKSGSKNIFIGNRSADIFGTGSSNISIGAFSNLGSSTGDNQLAIGRGIYGTDINSTADSKIGLGTATPTEKLEVEGAIKAGYSPTSGNVMLKDGYGNGSLFTLGNHYSSGGAVLGFGAQPKNGTSGYVASTGINIGRSIVYMNNAGINFLTEPISVKAIGDDLAPTSKMIIKNDGNVGIGTIDPSEKLDVKGKIAISSGNAHATIGSTAGGNLDFVANSNVVNAATNITFSSPLGIGSGAITEKMRIDSSGNVGIGTSSPQASSKLHLNDASQSYMQFRMTSGSSFFIGKYGSLYSSGSPFGLGANMTAIYEETGSLAIGAASGKEVVIGNNSHGRAITVDMTSKEVVLSDLAGPHINDEAYVCVDNAGRIYAKETACN